MRRGVVFFKSCRKKFTTRNQTYFLITELGVSHFFSSKLGECGALGSATLTRG